MSMLRNKPADRRGFTLIELLVVIAIIAILVSLTVAAVMAISGTDTKQDRFDINQMTSALQQFKVKYSFYPPSRLFLSNSRADYNNPPIPPNLPASWNAKQKAAYANALAQQSLEVLNRMFPPINWTTGINWNQAAVMPKGGVWLEGDQCLVFFLGGIPGPQQTCLGFSTNKQNPTFFSSPGAEKIQFYQFKPNRLTKRGGNIFYSYNNPFTDRPQPYAFMSAYKTQNGYNSAVSGSGLSDCASLGVNPYADMWPNPKTGQPPARFINPNSFQLISAGYDGAFGPGTFNQATVWSLTIPTKAPSGLDDISNFSDTPLGVGQ